MSNKLELPIANKLELIKELTTYSKENINSACEIITHIIDAGPNINSPKKINLFLNPGDNINKIVLLILQIWNFDILPNIMYANQRAMQTADDIVKRVQIQNRIAAGAYGSIYKAQSGSQKYIIKCFDRMLHNCLHPINLNEINMNRLFSSFASDVIAGFLYVGVHDFHVYAVMKNHGYSILYLLNNNYINIGNAAIITDKIKDAVDKFHSGGFIHGDISLGNILFNRNTQRIKFIDLGFAKIGGANFQNGKKKDLFDVHVVINEIFLRVNCPVHNLFS